MSRSSALQAATSKPHLSGGSNGGVKAVIFTPDFTAVDETIRILLRKHLPHGSKAEIAGLAGVHPNQLSRQLSGEDGLHNKTIGAALFVLARFPELHSVIIAVEVLRNGGAVEFREQVGLVIEFGTGQLCLPGVGP